MTETASDADHAVIEISDASRLPAQPVVSVVMLAYRHERYLADAIEGVLLQKTDFPVELIIAEDCSPDGTMAIAKRYQRQYPELVRIITSCTNVGMIENSVRAVAACRGTFIAWCEGDDYWHRADKLQRQVDVFASDPGISLVHTAWNHQLTWFGNDRVCVTRCARPEGQVSIQDRAFEQILRWETLVMTCTVAIRLSIVKAYLSTVDWRPFMVGDWPQFAFAAANGKVAYINLSTATYRRVPGSAMNSGAAMHIDRFRNAELIHQELERVLGPTKYPPWPRTRTLAGRLYQAAIEAHDVAVLREARMLLTQTGNAPSALRAKIDEAKARWPVLYQASRLYPNMVETVRKFIRYRPVSTHQAGR